MQKLLTSKQKQIVDNKTIEKENIESILLMERAALRIASVLINELDLRKKNFLIICGQGNNGGDGLALARILININLKVRVIFCKFSENTSKDCAENLKKLEKNYCSNLQIITTFSDLKIQKDEIIIDSLFGIGLNRSVKGKFAEIIKIINYSKNQIFSIDIPSGMFGEDNSENDGEIIRANKTFYIEFPAISAMFTENFKYFGDLEAININFDSEIINDLDTNFIIIDKKLANSKIKKRNPFCHKGNFGHALIVSGSYGKAGAAILASKACLRTGVGLLTINAPKEIIEILQISVPEAMIYANKNNFSFPSENILEKFSAIGIGPGIETSETFKKEFFNFLKKIKIPTVFDADALNILSEVKNFYEFIPKNSILTPHPKEFERLFGKFKNSWEIINFMTNFSQKYEISIILKGGITTITTTDGKIYFNIGKNPAIATAGSGDVLTGIITSLLAQNYTPTDAAILGVFLHSEAGKNAKEILGENSVIASDIIRNLMF